ncbi:Cytochrome b, partial [Cariama cristata]
TLIHFAFLHESDSNNYLGIISSCHKIPFHPYFSLKDTVGFILIIFPLTTL